MGALNAALFAIALTLVLFMILLSDGRVLDLRIGVLTQNPALLTISIACWVVVAAFCLRLTLGRWKTYYALKRAVLTGILIIPSLMVVFSMLPVAAPSWAGALLAGMVALVASMIANRFIPSPPQRLR
jgi:hypothetical protein